MIKRIFVLFLCAALFFSLTACNGDQPSPLHALPLEPEIPPPPEFPVVVGGATVLSRPGRVVSLSPSITEKIADLGLWDRLVGVSGYCDYPESADWLERCGTAQMPDVETIIKLRAHLVVSAASLPEEDRLVLLENEIDVAVIPQAQSLSEFWKSYISLARMFEGEYAGQEMGDAFTDAADSWLVGLHSAVQAEIAAQEAEHKPALYIRGVGTDKLFNVATGDTLVNDFMAQIGLINIAAEQTGWRYPEEIALGDGLEDFRSLKVMFFDEEYVSMKEDLETSEFYRVLEATKQDLFFCIDSNIMERQSLRSFEQLLAMAQYAWPEASLPSWPPRIAYSLNYSGFS